MIKLYTQNGLKEVKPNYNYLNNKEQFYEKESIVVLDKYNLSKKMFDKVYSNIDLTYMDFSVPIEVFRISNIMVFIDNNEVFVLKTRWNKSTTIKYISQYIKYENIFFNCYVDESEYNTTDELLSFGD